MRTSHRPRFIRWLALAAVLAFWAVPSAHAQTPILCEVLNANDSGIGSLRAAIATANAGLCLNNKISFRIDVPDVIVLQSALPPVARSITIDGYTQPGSAPSDDPTKLPGLLKVGIDGKLIASAGGCGLVYSAPGLVLGLIVRNFGTLDSGGSPIGSGICGSMRVEGSVIQNNGIGINASGNSVGNLGINDGNYIADNQLFGIYFGSGGVNAERNVIEKNGIGLKVICGSGGLVRYNEFVANAADGINLDNGSGISISANRIGLDRSDRPRPNGGNGILVRSGECGGSVDNLIDGNLIKFNTGNGISIVGATSVGNAIGTANSITNNKLKNIDLDYPGGPRPILPGGGSPGPNRLQNYPTITSVVDAGANTVVTFNLQSSPNRTFTVSSFRNSTFGAPAGELSRGQTTVTTNASGVVDGSITTLGINDNISLLAQDTSTKDTSEFSPMVAKALLPNVTLSANAMDFGNVPAGSTSPAKTVALTSSGPGNYVIRGLSATPVCGLGGSPICGSGDFTCSTTCTSDTIYAPTSSCTISATFKPSAVAASTADIYVCDNTSTSPQHITLSGNGVTPPPPPTPDATLSSNAIDFANVEIGTTDGPYPIQVTSVGDANYQVVDFFANADCTGTPICATGGFNCSSTCTPGSVWPPGSACSFTASFSPKLAGPSTTRIHLCDNTSTSPQVITLTGNGVVGPPPPPPPTPAVTLSDNLINFGDVFEGFRSETGHVQVLSTGTAPFRIRTFDASPTCDGAAICTSNFLCSTTCKPGTDYANGQSCEVSARFTPSVSGTLTTRIYICDNTATSPEIITLTGRGLPRAPPPPPPPTGSLEIGPVSFDFGDVRIGSRSGITTFIIINHATVDVRIVDLQVNGRGFVMTSTTCGSTLAAVSACYASVAFAPDQPGAANGSLDVSAAAGTAAASASHALLQGRGIVAPELVLPSEIDFGMFTIGSRPPLTQTITLTNTGGAALIFNSVSVSGPFTLHNDCPTTLGPSQSCTLRLEFSASVPGEFTGSLSVVSNVEGGSRAIRLVARAQPAPIPVITVAPVTIGFGSQLIGSTSASQRVTVKNEGGVVALLTAPSISADFLLLGSTCGTRLEPQASCVADIAMRPVGFGPRSGQLLINSDAPAGPAGAALAGTGCRPYVVGSNRQGKHDPCAP